MKILLKKWAKQQFDPPPVNATLYMWAKTGQIVPSPVKIGNRWYVEENAEYAPLDIHIAGLSDRARRILCQQGEEALA